MVTWSFDDATVSVISKKGASEAAPKQKYVSLIGLPITFCDMTDRRQD